MSKTTWHFKMLGMLTWEGEKGGSSEGWEGGMGLGGPNLHFCHQAKGSRELGEDFPQRAPI